MGCRMNEHALHSIAVSLRVALLAAIALLLLYVMSGVLLLVFAAVLMACVLRGGADKIHDWTGIGRGWSLLLLIVVLLAVSGGAIWWRGPEIADQTGQIAQNFVQQGERLKEYVQATSWGPQLADQIGGSGWSILGKIGLYVPSVFGAVLGLGSTLVILVATGLFFAISPGLYRDGLVRLLPVAWRPRGRDVLDGMGEALKLWFVGQLVDMIAVTVLTGAGLYLLGVKLAITLALFAGLLNFVPYIGALAGSVPALLVASAQSPTLVLYTAILVAVVQTLEGNVIAPLIQKRTVHLPPALTILSQTVLGSLFGLLGIILATPFAAATMVFVNKVYVESTLESGVKRPE